jgi:hypothetical protein
MSKQTIFPNFSHLHLQLIWFLIEILKIFYQSEGEFDVTGDEYSNEVAL